MGWSQGEWRSLPGGERDELIAWEMGRRRRIVEIGEKLSKKKQLSMDGLMMLQLALLDR